MLRDKVSRRPKSGDRAIISRPVIIIGVLSIIGAIVALVLASQSPTNVPISLLSSFIVFVASSLISYFITYSNERVRFQKELATLAAFARRRVDLLRQNLLSLSSEIQNIESAELSKRMVAYTLANLEQDAHASVREIEELGGIAEEYKEYVRLPIEEAKSIDSVSMTVDRSSSAEDVSSNESIAITYSCINCGMSNASSLNITVGSTRHVECGTCSTRLTLHRIRGGGFKVVNPLAKRLSNFADTERAQAFTCPRCQNRVTYQAKIGQITVERPCFSCLSVVSYDIEKGFAKVNSLRQPKAIGNIEQSPFSCDNCGSNFEPRVVSTNEGKRFICCFNCNAIYTEKKDSPSNTIAVCSNVTCGSEVVFKVKPSEPIALQICFECKSRLSYNKSTGAVETLERLDVPEVSQIEFRTSGRHCPHCDATCSDGWRQNSKGERLSMCWSCKNVFKFAHTPAQPLD